MSNSINIKTQPQLTSSLIIVLALSGCAQQAQTTALAEMRTEVASLQTDLNTTNAQIADWQTMEIQANSEAEVKLEEIQRTLGDLTKSVDKQCPTAPTANNCSDQRQVVVNADDKMVLGGVERVWIDPPGIHMVARIDTGASSSSLNATEITPFERDGDNWVRFILANDDAEVTIERPVSKYVRVFQQADKTGSRRPVVELRLFLGDIKATFSFTLADRSHLEHNMILGRNFLTDMALVDVSKQFVQPQYQPSQ